MKKILLILLLVCLALAYYSPSVANAAQKRTRTAYVSTTSSGVTVIPYVRSDKYALILDFENFTGVTSVYYNMNYTNVSNGIMGGAEGTFTPSKALYTGYYNGKPYIRRELLFGTCSKNVCSLHRAKDLKVTVVTKMKNGKQYTNIINIPNDQL